MPHDGQGFISVGRCEVNAYGLEPVEYVRDVLAKIATWQQEEIQGLDAGLPHNRARSEMYGLKCTAAMGGDTLTARAAEAVEEIMEEYITSGETFDPQKDGELAEALVAAMKQAAPGISDEQILAVIEAIEVFNPNDPLYPNNHQLSQEQYVLTS